MKQKRGLLIVASVLLSALFLPGCSPTDKNEEPKQTSPQVQSTTAEPTTAVVTTEEPTTEEPTTEAAPSAVQEEKKQEEIKEEYKEKAESSEEEKPQENSYSDYLGTWSNSFSGGGGFTVTFSSIDGNVVEMYLCKVAPNAAHIAATEKISATIENDEINFNFSDSFMNSGKGVITLNGDTISLSLNITEPSDPFIYGLLGKGELTKKSDSTAIPYM